MFVNEIVQTLPKNHMKLPILEPICVNLDRILV